MPLFSTFFFLFTLGNLGFPGTVNFVGELLVLLGIYKNNIFTAFLGSLGIFLGVIYSIWLYNRVIFGKLKKKILIKFKDLNLREFLLLLPLSILMFIMGIKPILITESLNTLSAFYISPYSTFRIFDWYEFYFSKLESQSNKISFLIYDLNWKINYYNYFNKSF